MKRLAFPTLILIIVAAIWLIYSNYESNRISGRTVDNFLGLNPDEVDSITIITPIDTTILYIENERWYLADSIPRLAEAPAISNVLAKSSEIEVGDIHSENPARQDEFQVSDNLGIHVSYYSEGKLLNSIIVGKPSQDYQYSYVRLSGEDAVYKAKGVLAFVFARERNQWLDRAIFSFSPDSIAAMEFIYPDKGYRIELTDSVWYLSKISSKEKNVADTAKIRVAKLLISSLKANDFINATDSGKINFDKIAFTLKVRLLDDTAYGLEFSEVKDDAHRHYCRRSDLGDDIFVIFTSVYGSLTRDISHFLP